MKPTEPLTDQPRSTIASDGVAARRRRDRQLTMNDRLERVHHICAQLASLKPVGTKHH